MPNLPNAVLWSIPAFVLLTVIEIVSFLVHPDEDELGYTGKDTATSLTMGLGSLVTNLGWKIPAFALYNVLYAVAPVHVPVHWWTTVPLMLLGQDLCYYWSHRSTHRVRLLWAQHVVHHSSRNYNLSTALRQPWTDLTFGLFYAPLVLLGVSPAAVAFCSPSTWCTSSGSTPSASTSCRARSSSSSTPRTTGCTTPRRAATWTATSAAS